MEKIGFMLFTGNAGVKALHIEQAPGLPFQNIMSPGTWASSTEMSKLTFANFMSKETLCGQQ